MRRRPVGFFSPAGWPRPRRNPPLNFLHSQLKNGQLLWTPTVRKTQENSRLSQVRMNAGQDTQPHRRLLPHTAGGRKHKADTFARNCRYPANLGVSHPQRRRHPLRLFPATVPIRRGIQFNMSSATAFFPQWRPRDAFSSPSQGAPQKNGFSAGRLTWLHFQM